MAVASHDTVTQIIKCMSEHVCKSSRPCSNMHRAINTSAKRICTRYAQKHQLAKAFSKALACEVMAAQTSATHTHIRALIYVNNMVTLLHRHRRHCVHAIRAKNKSEHICKSSRPCSNMHRAINKSAKPLADMCIICVCELLPVHKSNRIVM